MTQFTAAHAVEQDEQQEFFMEEGGKAVPR